MDFVASCRSSFLTQRIGSIAAAFFLILTVPAFAQFTGSWSGTYTELDQCPQQVTVSGNVAAALTQTGSNVTGTVTLDLYPDYCTSKTPLSVIAPLNGTVSGNTLTGVILMPTTSGVEEAGLIATVSGTTMTIRSSDPSDTFLGTATRTSSDPPDSTLSGGYSGTYTFREVEDPPCKNMGDLLVTGPVTGTVTQGGSAVNGVFVAHELKNIQRDGAGNCTLVSAPDFTFYMIATLSGNTLSGSFIAQGHVEAVTASVSGTTISTTIQTPTQTISFTLTKSSVTPAPSIATFAANPSTIQQGQATDLSWVVLNSTSVSIDNGIGTQPASGSVSVTPAQTTTYTLTASSSGGTATASTTVTVTQTAPPPRVVVSAYPQGMLQAVGSALPGDHYTLTNIGGTATTVTIGKSGQNFFTQTPVSFQLAAGASGVVYISATQQPAGTYDGLSTVAGTGVPSGMAVAVHLVVAAPPGAPVSVTTTTSRVELTAPVGQNPSGSVSFTNPSSTPISGVVVADVPWIIIPNASLTLAANETRAVAYSIDRGQRPDSAAPVGGASGTLAFRYVNAATGKAMINTTTVQSELTVSIVDVVTLSTTAGPPPGLPAGENAIFVPGFHSRTFSDLGLSNASDRTIGDLRMYFTVAGGGGTQMVTPGSFPSNGVLSFPSVVKTIFGLSSMIGTLQLRTAQSGSVSVAPLQSGTTLGQSYVTAVPVFRSNAGYDAGQDLLLPGVEKSANTSTNLVLQEMLGTAAALQIDFYDAAGKLVSSRSTDILTAFGSVELQDVVPAGAATAKIRTTTTGSRIQGYALVKDAVTGDSFTLVQLGGNHDPAFVPSFAAVSGSRDIVLNLTSADANGSSVTATVVSTPGCRRHVTTHGTTELLPATDATMTIPFLGMQKLTIGQNGFLKLSGASQVRATARFTSPRNGGAFGSGITVSPQARALPADTFRRFAGIEDSSPATIAAARPGTYRTNLMLIETLGQPARVRLTLRYLLTTGSLVSSGAVTQRDIDLPAGGFALLTDVGEAILGPQRRIYGDFHNAILDVGILAGPGTVVPYLQVIENASGDIAVRN